MKFLSVVSLAAVLGVSPVLNAQEIISLEADDMLRLGLVFQRAAAAGQGAGSSFPARVVSSPSQSTEHRAMFDGVLESWQVMPGEEVEKGGLLGLVRSAEVLDLQHQWLQASNELKLAGQTLQRDRQLFADGVIAESRLQQAERSYSGRQLAENSAAALLISAGYTAADLARLNETQHMLGYYRVLAPSAGMVGHLHVMPGDALESGELLVSLSSGTLWVSAEIPARLAGQISVGETISVSGESELLTVKQKDMAVDHDMQTVGVLAEFAGPVSLMPGQVVSMQLPAPQSGVQVPAEAVVHNGDQTQVYVKVPGGIEARVVQLQAFGSDYLASTGISSNDELVVRGAALLKGIQLGLGGE